MDAATKRPAPATKTANLDRIVDLSTTYFLSSVSAADPANTLRPSASVTLRALASLEPSLAREPSTLTLSPGFSELRVQPRRIRAFGLPSSGSQLVTVPESSFTSI